MKRNRAFAVLISIIMLGSGISYSFDYACNPQDIESLHDGSDEIYIANINGKNIISENEVNGIITTKVEYDIEVLKNLKGEKTSGLYKSKYTSKLLFYSERALEKGGIYLIYGEQFHGLCPSSIGIAAKNDYKNLDIYKYIKRSDSVLYNLSIKFQLWIHSQINQVEQHDNLSIKKKLYGLFLACEKLLSDECGIVSKECVLQNNECQKKYKRKSNVVENDSKKGGFVPAEKID